MSIGFFLVRNVSYLWLLIVEVGTYLKYAIFNYFYDVIKTKGHLTLAQSKFNFILYLRPP